MSSGASLLGSVGVSAIVGLSSVVQGVFDMISMVAVIAMRLCV